MAAEPQSALAMLNEGMSHIRILVVGDIMLDRYITGEVNRISPEAPVPVLLHAKQSECPGGAANVAMNLVGLGCQTFLVGAWGKDDDQQTLEGILTAAGVSVSGVVTSSRPTVSKTRIGARTQQIVRLDVESRDSLSPSVMKQLEANVIALIGQVHAIVLSDYAKGTLSDQLCRVIIDSARQAGVPVLVDPKTTDFQKYAGATTVCPNIDELSKATGIPHDQTASLMAAAQQQMLQHHFAFMTVTMSEKGIQIVGRDSDSCYYSPACARQVFDVSGAGDTVIATLAASVAGGLLLRAAVDLANVAAGIVVGRVGTSPIDRRELLRSLMSSAEFSSAGKLVSLRQIQRRVEEWRAGGEIVVFTSGDFDLIHVGHVALLDKCKQLGTKVVVGIGPDILVTNGKGAIRPIVSCDQRARVVAAMSSVDAVVVLEGTATELVNELKPDIIVKGENHSSDIQTEYEASLTNDSRVHIQQVVENWSVSTIIQRLLTSFSAGD